MGDIEFSFKLNYGCEPENKRIMERIQSSGFRRIFTVAYLTLKSSLISAVSSSIKTETPGRDDDLPFPRPGTNFFTCRVALLFLVYIVGML